VPEKLALSVRSAKELQFVGTIVHVLPTHVCPSSFIIIISSIIFKVVT